MNFNKVIITGNLTKDIEIKALPSGAKVANLSIATNRTYKDSEGNKKEDVNFTNLVAFGVQAENLAKYAVKGQNMLFEGRLQTRSWEGTDGKKAYATEVVVESFQFGKKPGETSSGPTAEQRTLHSDPRSPFSKPQEGEFNDAFNYPVEDFNPDDVPF